MSTPAGASTASMAPPPRRAADHEHAWRTVMFELVDDRPMVRQACDACGAVRRYRACERYWIPGGRGVHR